MLRRYQEWLSNDMFLAVLYPNPSKTCSELQLNTETCISEGCLNSGEGLSDHHSLCALCPDIGHQT